MKNSKAINDSTNANNDSAADGNNRATRLAIGGYFALGMFAIFACDNYFGVIALSTLGGGMVHLTYGVGSIAAALGVALSVLFGIMFKRREKAAKIALLVCYPVAAMLMAAASFAKSPAAFLGSLLPFYLLVGLNTGLCTRFLCKLDANGGAGKTLGLSACIGIAASYILDLFFPFGSVAMILGTAICLAAAIFAMMSIMVLRLDLPNLMKLEAAPEATAVASQSANRANRRYLYVFCAVCGAIAVMSYMIGVNDITIFTALWSERAAPLAYFLPRLLYFPGLFLAGLLADMRNGKYLPIATLGCVFISAPVIGLINQPNLFTSYSWVTYFVGGFFLIYIMMCLTALSLKSRHPAIHTAQSGFLFFLFSGLGALSSGVFIKTDAIVSLSVYAALALCLLIAFYLSGNLRAAPLATPEPDDINPAKTFDEMIIEYAITEREAEALRLLLANKNTSEIASAMVVTEGTVYKYISSMIAKTGSKTRVDMVTKFSRLDVIVR